ncbi:hypothetical protein AO398_24530 [Methylobacterium sp. GXS13]|jgi:hypothetical protein|uniref:hypothetical protein n=1 Tax=Methylobacterium sp. GXS13 TaxID=1730094 RepID=UPI00071B2CC9|nr:hypothetical protein [Methylobacterium sp. GXS13]KST57612.1 hypothetical protein AO398_24530 [Methylobacterium sp. GXS13]
MDDADARDHDAASTLGLIAQALNLPIATLFSGDQAAPPTEPAIMVEGDDLAQTAELLRLFLMLKDLEARERCLDFVGDLVAREP